MPGLHRCTMDSRLVRASPVESACGPTYVLAEPSPVDAQYDHHSSEEELEVINSMESAMSGCGAAAAPEKRTWSQAAAAPTPPSSDEEVGAPVRFRTEPPLEARRPRHRAPSPHRLAPHAHYEASPRKRSRHLTRRQRPCLDFDKMQQLKVRAVWRHHSGDHGGELSVFCW